MTPTKNKMITTMTITPMIPTPPFLFISISQFVGHLGRSAALWGILAQESG
jgi:hypothetical protein